MWSAIALAFGLAMDATAVAAARGLGAGRSREAVVLPLLFGGFQAGMAALGWFAGRWAGPYIAAWDHWVAFGLLVVIGGKMLFDAWRGGGDDGPRGPATLTLALGLALATSIDAAAAGLTLPLVPVAPWIALLLIGVVTTACSAAGYLVGGFAGKHLGSKLEVVGGLVLIGIGVRLVIGAHPGGPGDTGFGPRFFGAGPVQCSKGVDRTHEWKHDVLATALAHARDAKVVLHTFGHAPTIDLEEYAPDFDWAARNGVAMVTFRQLANGFTGAGWAFTIDDDEVDTWYGWRDFLRRHHVRVTFFVSRYAKFTADQRRKLHELAGDGHDIEAHGRDHANAIDYTAAHGLDGYVRDEVLASKAALTADGFAPVAFAYPYGAHTQEIDDALKPQFRLLRTTGTAWCLKPQSAAAAAPTPAAAAPPRETAPPATTTAAAAVPTHVKLPRSPSTPPHKTTRPLAQPELDRLAAIEFPDFERRVMRSDGPRVQFEHTTATRPKLAVVVTIEPCSAPCLTMELPAWQAQRAALRRQLISPQLVDRPDTRFELGAREVAGTPMIYTYQVGWSFETDPHGQPSGTYSDSYALHFNDRINQIRVRADYADDATGSARDMLALAPKEDLEKLAVAFLDFYVHEWR